MSMLSSLVRAYDRLPDPPSYGYALEKIGFCIILNCNGSVDDVVDLRGDDKKRSPRLLAAPQAWKKASGVKPNFLWEKSSYALGVTAGEGRRTAQEHQAFRDRHAEWLAGSEEPGLLALLRFLDGWTPEQYKAPLWPDDLRDQNIVFALAGDYRADIYLHSSAAARHIWANIRAAEALDRQICLVSGEKAPVARLHPSIKGVWGAQTAGASLISFNAPSYESYGHIQGANAPVSESAAFAYTTVLNHFLAQDSEHRLQIGDASTVFWADCADAKVAIEAEATFQSMIEGAAAGAPADDGDRIATRAIRERLDSIRKGLPLADIAPRLAEGVRFHVLGLAPNAARLAVRFYQEDDFGALVAHYQRYLRDTAIEPPPRDGWPPLWRYLVELAVQGKRENVPPLVAGGWVAAILSGTPYPLTLLSVVLMRVRADHQMNALRAAMLKSVLVRNFQREVPVALDPENTDKGYLLGRLFAAYEEVQRAALGGKVNATIRDKFYGSASATPRKVFPLLDRGAANHFGKLRKESPGRAVNLTRLISDIYGRMAPAGDPMPVALPAAEQAMFAIGYYHQNADFFRKKDTTEEGKE